MKDDTSIKVPPETYKLLKAIAKRESRTIRAVIKLAVDRYQEINSWHDRN